MILWIWAVAAFAIGLAVGGKIVEYKWRGNAKVPMRIYSGKRLYKVKYADEREGDGE